MHGQVLLAIVLVLIADAADDLLQQIFDRHQAGHTPVLINHNAHVLLLALHLPQQFIDPLGFRDEGGYTLDTTHGLRAGGRIGDMEQVVGEADPGNVIERALKNRHARIRMLLQFGDKAFHRHVDRNSEDMRPRRHDITHNFVAKLHRGADQIAVPLFNNAFFLPRLDQGLDRCLAWVFLSFARPRLRQI